MDKDLDLDRELDVVAPYLWEGACDWFDRISHEVSEYDGAELVISIGFDGYGFSGEGYANWDEVGTKGGAGLITTG